MTGTPPRLLGLVPATCLVVGQVVGIGVFLAPARRVTPGVFVGLCFVLLGLLLVGRTVQALSGVLVVAAGVPAFALLRRTGVLRSEEA